MSPTHRGNCVPIRTYKYLIVITNAEFPPRQGPPSFGTEPGRMISGMLPATSGLVTREIIYLKDRLTPGSFYLSLGKLFGEPKYYVRHKPSMTGPQIASLDANV